MQIPTIVIQRFCRFCVSITIASGSLDFKLDSNLLFLIRLKLMKLLLNIKKDKLGIFLEMLKNFSDSEAERISEKDLMLLNEIKQIKQAFSHADDIKAGKLTARPIQDLLDEL